MIARMVRVRLPPHRIDEWLAAYREKVRSIHAGAAGLRCHYVLVERDAGQLVSVGVYESEAAFEAIVASLRRARQDLWEPFGVLPPLESFEVADALDAAMPG